MMSLGVHGGVACLLMHSEEVRLRRRLLKRVNPPHAVRQPPRLGPPRGQGVGALGRAARLLGAAPWGVLLKLVLTNRRVR